MEEKDLLQNSCGGFPYPVTTQDELATFSCGDNELDGFFHHEAYLYSRQLLGKTYYFSTTGADRKIVCAFTLANDSIKAALFVHPNNKTGCRFIVVDAYNNDDVIRFYGKNGFRFLYATEDLEREAYHIPADEHLESRMMYLDLLGYIM